MPYDSVCHVMSIITHVLFVFVFCWLFMLSILQLLHILMPKKEAVIDKSSITLFFAGYGNYFLRVPFVAIFYNSVPPSYLTVSDCCLFD